MYTKHILSGYVKEDDEVCFTLEGCKFHIPEFIPLKQTSGYTRSRCGVIDSATFAHFYIWRYGDLPDDIQARREPCKRCYKIDR